MKEPAKRAGIIGGAPDMVLRRNPSRAGLVSRISETLGGLIHPKPNETSAEEVAESQPKKIRNSGAYRSAMNAGITGGISLLDGSRDQRP